MIASIDSPLAVIQSVFPSLRGISILDAGCGEGVLARQLVAEGASVTGIDSSPEAVSRAKALEPAATFELASAEAMPFEDGAFDAVVIVNALHHVHLEAMDTALDEVARVVRPGGTLIVIEPLAEGSFFNALRVVEDETAVRRAAQQALVRAVERGRLTLNRTVSYTRRETFNDVSHFLQRIIAVDPTRAATVQAKCHTITAQVLEGALKTDDGKLILDQPIKADIFWAKGG